MQRKVPSRLNPTKSPELRPDSPPTLTHYTESVGTLVSILTHGFVMGAPPQRLIRHLLPDVYGKLAKRPEPVMEPEQFGAVSFTEAPPDEAGRVRNRFGPYGVIVSDGWVLRRHPQKVEYVDPRAPGFPAMRARYEATFRELQALVTTPDGALVERAIWNADMAYVCGARRWAKLCYEYRHLEHIGNAYQREWRIFNRFPSHGPRTSKVTDVLPPSGWHLADGIRMFHIKREEVAALVAPRGMSAEVRRQLPHGYGNVPIIEPAS